MLFVFTDFIIDFDYYDSIDYVCENECKWIFVVCCDVECDYINIDKDKHKRIGYRSGFVGFVKINKCGVFFKV